MNFDGEDIRPSFAEYAALLREGCPEFFVGAFARGLCRCCRIVALCAALVAVLLYVFGLALCG